MEAINGYVKVREMSPECRERCAKKLYDLTVMPLSELDHAASALLHSLGDDYDTTGLLLPLKRMIEATYHDVAGILETVTQRVGEITIVRDADNIIHSCLLEPKIPERSAEKGQEQVASPDSQPYADDLIDQISIGYSAVDDMLKRIETEPDSDAAATLASMARVLYRNAVARKDKIVRELEKQTGKIWSSWMRASAILSMICL